MPTLFSTGADCVMLSGETAKGAYPTEAVKMMAETAYLAEQSVSYVPLFNEMRTLTTIPTTNTNETIAMAAVAASLEQHAGAILLMSTSGNTARLVSKYRPSCPILVITRNPHTARDVHLYRGCYPFLYPHVRPEDNSKWQGGRRQPHQVRSRRGPQHGHHREGEMLSSRCRAGGHRAVALTLSAS